MDQLPIGTLFQYDTKKVFSFKVSKIVRKKNETLKKRELEFHSEEDLEKPTTYVIHFGYLRVLAGFLQEIQFMEDDKLQSHNCLFRATYLSMILDMFVEELPRIPAKTPWRFRSRVLNPLLQRQLRGIHDDDPTQVEMEVGHGRAAAGKFYLELDPLDPKLANQMLRNILYIWQVRLSLGYLMATTRGEEQSMTSAITNTKDLLESRAKTPDDVWDSHVLMDYEIRLVQRETLEAFYKPLLLVSIFFLSGRLSASLPACSCPKSRTVEKRTLRRTQRLLMRILKSRLSSEAFPSRKSPQGFPSSSPSSSRVRIFFSCFLFAPVHSHYIHLHQ